MPSRARASCTCSWVSNTITESGRTCGRESRAIPSRPASAPAPHRFPSTTLTAEWSHVRADTVGSGCSRKGEIRARIASTLINEWKSGELTAMIARSADFYCPTRKTPSPICSSSSLSPESAKRHGWSTIQSRTPRPTRRTQRAARCSSPSGRIAWTRTWHVPTTPNPLTGREFVALAAKEFGVAPRYRAPSRPMLQVVGWFDSLGLNPDECCTRAIGRSLRFQQVRQKNPAFPGRRNAEGIRTTATSVKRDPAPIVPQKSRSVYLSAHKR